MTGDTKYLDRAASAIDSFNKYLQVKDGYAGLTDVNDPTADKIDDMESFWFAEVLKYLWVASSFAFSPERVLDWESLFIGTSHSMIQIISVSMNVRPLFSCRVHAPMKSYFETDVFNTEAHPFKAPPAKASYGSGHVKKPTGTFKMKSGGPLPAISPNPFLPKTTAGP